MGSGLGNFHISQLHIRNGVVYNLLINQLLVGKEDENEVGR